MEEYCAAMATTLTAIPTPQSETLRAFLYARNSRDPKRRGRSTDDQMDENRTECEDRGWTWNRETDEFTDTDRSASRHAKKARDNFETMVNRIEAGECDVLVTWESSRLQRDLEVYVKLRRICLKAGVLWCYNGTVYDMSNRSDRRNTAMDAIQAEDESEAIRLRNLRTTRLNAKRGGAHGRIPYGYTREYDPKTGDLLRQVPEPAEAAVVQEIFKRFASGKSAESTAAYLNAEYLGTGRLGRRGQLWNHRSVVRLIRNKPTYIGKRQHNGVIVGDALWPGIVDPDVYQGVQRMLSDPTRLTTRNTEVTHLLSGIATCAVEGCGNRLYIMKNCGGRSYTCKPSAHVSIRKASLEAAVEFSVIEWLASPEAASAFQGADRSEEAAASLAEIDRLNAELQEAQHLVLRRKLSVGSLAALEAGILPEIERHRRVAHAGSLPSVVRDIVGAADAAARWDDLELDQKRVVLRAVVEVRVGKGRPGVRAIEPGRVQLRFHGQTEWKG
jgi:site-specific DNA recombinase